MTPDIASICDLLKESIQHVGQIKAYVFGSASRPNTVPSDIDILIIYNEPAQPRVLRDLLREVNYIPVHLIFLTIEEEIETNFIMEQNCIPIL